MRRLVDSGNIHSLKKDLIGVGVFIGLIWLVFVLDRLLPLEQFGLVPRSFHGLLGIVTMPFLHSDTKHLIGNSIPLAVTLALLAGSRVNSSTIVIMISLLAGILLWMFGRTALHIGASVLVFGLITFHIVAGFAERRISSLIISLGVGLLYSATILQGIVPFQRGVSWDGHLSGAVAGALIALSTARQLHSSKTTSKKSLH